MSQNSEEQARAQLASVVEMVAALKCDFDRLAELRDERDLTDDADAWAAENPEDAAELAELEAAAGECTDADEARQRIEEDALSVEVRGDWYAPGGEDGGPTEYRILLCTGGPAVQIVGDLGRHGEPDSARLMHQDWFEGWTELVDISSDEREALLTYARAFYFGEG